MKLHDICDNIALGAVDKEQWNTLLFLKLDDIQQQFAVAYKQYYLASTRQDDFDDVKSKIQAMSRVMKRFQKSGLPPEDSELRSSLKPDECQKLGLDNLLEEVINAHSKRADCSDVLRQAEAEVDKNIENEQLLMETIEKVLLFYTYLIFSSLYDLELPNKNTLEGARELLKNYKVSEARKHPAYGQQLDNFIESHTGELVQAEDFKESGEGRATAANDWKMLDDDLEAGKITINEWQDRAKEIRAELRSFWLETPPMLSANLLSSALKNKTHTLNRALMVFDWPIDEDLIDSAASLMDITLLELLATRQKLKAIGIGEAERSTAECQEYYSLSLELFSTCFDEGFFANFDQKIDPREHNHDSSAEVAKKEKVVAMYFSSFKNSVERADLTIFKAYFSHEETVEQINALDYFTGETVLHDAIKLAILEPEHWDDRVEIASSLIKHPNVDLSMQNKEGKTVLDFAYDPCSLINRANDASRVEETELRRRGNHLTRLIIARNLQLNLANEATSVPLKNGLGVMDKGVAMMAQALDARLQYYQAKNDKDGVKGIISLTGQINELMLLILSNKYSYEDKINYLNHFTKRIGENPDLVPPTSRLYRAIGFFAVMLILSAFLLALNIAPDSALTSWASSESEAANTVSGVLLLGAGAATYKNAAPWSFYQLRKGYSTICDGANEVCNMLEPISSPPALDETPLLDPRKFAR